VYNRVCRLTRKLVDHRNSSISKHDNTAGDQIETLIHDECHPSLDDKIMFVQRNQCHEVLGVNEIRGSGCEDPYTKLDRETHSRIYIHPATEHHPVKKARIPVAFLGAIAATQWYIPPSVGYAETNSAREAPRKHCSVKTRRKP
jgi:hypothetical protein